MVCTVLTLPVIVLGAVNIYWAIDLYRTPGGFSENSFASEDKVSDTSSAQVICSFQGNKKQVVPS